MADALAVVKVGNSECEFLRLTPLSRTSAMAGAVSGVTESARSPSGTNRMTLFGRGRSAALACSAKTTKASASIVLNLDDITLDEVISNDIVFPRSRRRAGACRLRRRLLQVRARASLTFRARNRNACRTGRFG